MRHPGRPGFPPSWILLVAVLTALPIRGLAEEGPIAAAVASIAMTVADMDRSVEFYTNVLTFERLSDVEVWGAAYEQAQGVFGLRMRVVRMRLGEEVIDLMQYLAPEGRPIPVDARSHDRWFQHIAIIVSDMNAAYQRLRRFNVRHASSGPQRLPDWNRNAGGIQAFYFKDPDGHVLEILEFPDGKGESKWRRPHGNQLFLGIDHTAIVVSDTDQGLRFYRDVLGLRVVGESENYGTEQEHLNNVAGAHLRITALRAAAGPGIEFVEYLTPKDGRPRPPDARPNDLLHWQTRLRTANAAAAAERLRKARAPFVSSGAVKTQDARLGFTASLLIQDPDGHAVQLVEEAPPVGTAAAVTIPGLP